MVKYPNNIVERYIDALELEVALMLNTGNTSDAEKAFHNVRMACQEYRTYAGLDSMDNNDHEEDLLQQITGNYEA